MCWELLYGDVLEMKVVGGGVTESITLVEQEMKKLELLIVFCMLHWVWYIFSFQLTRRSWLVVHYNSIIGLCGIIFSCVLRLFIVINVMLFDDFLLVSSIFVQCRSIFKEILCGLTM